MEDYEVDRSKTNAELRDKYLTYARRREELAILRRRSIRERAERDIDSRYPKMRRTKPTEFIERVTALTDIYCFGSSNTVGDPTYKGHIEANKWYTQYAQMYAMAAIGDDMRKLTATMESLERYLRTKDM